MLIEDTIEVVITEETTKTKIITTTIIIVLEAKGVIEVYTEDAVVTKMTNEEQVFIEETNGYNRNKVRSQKIYNINLNLSIFVSTDQ